MVDKVKRQIKSERSNSVRRKKIFHTKEEPKEATKLKKKLTGLAEKMDDAMVQMAVLSQQLEDYRTEAEDVMVTMELTSFVVAGVGEHIMFAKKANDKNVIDIEKYWEEVTEDDFFKTVSVTKAAAQDVLSNKAIEKISDKTVGKMGDPSYKFEPLKVK